MALELNSSIRRILSGDKEAYSYIVQEHQDMLVAYASLRLPDRSLVDEVVQQTFIRAFDQIRQYDTQRDFGTWLRSICKYMILSELNRQIRERRRSVTHMDRLRAHLLERAAREDPLPPQEMRMGILERCLSELSEATQSLVRARYVDRTPLGQIAERLGRSGTWATTTLWRARLAVRRCVEKQIGTQEAEA
jgi:RNA polymerase sigma-70 factor, ECF subfamily